MHRALQLEVGSPRFLFRGHWVAHSHPSGFRIVIDPSRHAIARASANANADAKVNGKGGLLVGSRLCAPEIISMHAT